MNNIALEQAYLQQLQQQAPIHYVYGKYNLQQAQVIAKEFWNEFKPKLPDVMQTLFGIKPTDLAVNDNFTLRQEYHAAYEVKCGYHKWVKYNISYAHTENVEYGYQDYAGNWHHAYNVPETSYSSESSGGMASRDVKKQEFYERKTDSPVLHRWITPNEKNTFTCSNYSSASEIRQFSYGWSIARPIDAQWDQITTMCKNSLVSEVRSNLQESVRGGTVGFDSNVVKDDCRVEKRVLMWPFYFADYKVGEHTFTVRIDASNGFLNLYLDNPNGTVTQADETNSRLQAIERREGKRDEREAKHNQFMRDSNIDEDKLGNYTLICGIASIILPIILSIVAFVFGAKTLKYADEGRGKAIAGIVIAVIVLLIYAFYFIGVSIIMREDPDFFAHVLTLPLI